MAAQLFTLAAPAQYVEEIKKSRFLTFAAPVASAEAALAFFASVSDPTATHNCWAFRVGQTYRFNDDGEPGGTAGRPMLQAIDGQQCDRVAVLCIRWYGGINLGTGGLARAYGGGAAQCLRLAERVPIIDTVALGFRCGFGEWPVLRARLAPLDAVFREPTYLADGVEVVVDIPRERANELRVIVSDISRGKAEVTLIGA
jgi:uncharacterized YigZ family protein